MLEEHIRFEVQVGLGENMLLPFSKSMRHHRILLSKIIRSLPRPPPEHLSVAFPRMAPESLEREKDIFS